MPKVTPAKSKKPAPSKTAAKAPSIAPKPPEPEKVLFRLFECLVHVEQAEDHIKNVGIFVEPDLQKARELQDRAAAAIRELRTYYLNRWIETTNKGN